MKRGRGRPRKNSMTSDMSNTQNSYLEEGKLNKNDNREQTVFVTDTWQIR